MTEKGEKERAKEIKNKQTIERKRMKERMKGEVLEKNAPAIRYTRRSSQDKYSDHVPKALKRATDPFINTQLQFVV